MNQEMDALWKWCNHAQAQMEATNLMLGAVVELLKDDPKFAAALRARRVLAEAHIIAGENDGNEFIATYRQKLAELTPPKLR